MQQPESVYAELGYYHYNALIRAGGLWFQLSDSANRQLALDYKALCEKYYLDPIPNLLLMGHAIEILTAMPEAAEGLTAIEQPTLTGTEWYTFRGYNVINLDSSPITITSVDAKTMYVEGIDYEISPGELSYPFPTTNMPWMIRRIAYGSIPDGGKVRLTYCYVKPNSESYCPSEPQVVDYASNAIKKTMELMNPKYIHIGHDEIGVLGYCPRCRVRGLSNADLLADEVGQLHDAVHQYNSNCKVMIWADTFDLQQNAEGLDLRYLIDLLPDDLIICHWWYYSGELDWMRANMIHSTSRGFVSVGTVWNETQNAIEWTKVLKENNNWNGLSRGVIFVPWYDDWTAMATTAQWAWSSRLPMPDLPNQKTRSITQITGTAPTGLSLNLPFYQTFDLLDDRALLVPWVFNYTPDATTSVRYYGTSGKSFEVSGTRLDGRGVRMFLDNTVGYGYLYLSQRVYMSSTNSTYGSRSIELYGPDGVAIATLQVVYRSGIFRLQRISPIGTFTVGTFPTNQWVLLDIMVNLDQNTWSVSVNGSSVFTNVAYTLVGDVSQIGWNSTSVGGSYNGFWLDNVKVEHYASPYAVTGKVSLGDYRTSNIADTQVTFEIWQNNVIVGTKTANLKSDGAYSFESPVQGIVKIRAKALHWLTKMLSSITVPGTANFNLINGDINDDNSINVLDYAQMKANYNKTGVAGHAAD